VLAFVEVKARRPTDVLRPSQNVRPWKHGQIVRAAWAHLGARERRERVTRFDVVEVHMTAEDRVSKLELIQGALKA
jgi:Holliday junction resolvase-like predicted endonuclease